MSLRDEYLQKTSYCIKDSQRADVVVLWLKRLLAEAQAETVERCLEHLEKARKVFSLLPDLNCHEIKLIDALTVGIRALSPDPEWLERQKQRWELEAKIRELHDWPELCNGDTGVPERHKKLCKYHRTLELYECQLAALPEVKR